MSDYYVGSFIFSSNDICHHGVKGQKWGVRRYVNPDGTLTPEGERKYGTYERFQEIDRAKRDKRDRLQEQRRKASIARGRELYNSGYKHSKNVMRTLGKATAKTIVYGVSAKAARELGMHTLSGILTIGGAASVGATLASGTRKVIDYEQNARYTNTYKKDKKRR